MVEQQSRCVHLVVHCTRGKRGVLHPDLQAGELQGETIPLRAKEWMHRLSRVADSHRAMAADVYKGDHWAVARGIEPHEGSTMTLWVASAGYGLIQASDLIAPYEATFSPTNGDKVSCSEDEARAWWGELAKRTPVGVQGEVRSLEGLAASAVGASILVAVSPRYLAALNDDLQGAVRVLHEREEADRLTILATPGCAVHEELQPRTVEVPGALRLELGGALGSVTSRLARWLIEGARSPLTTDRIRRRVRQLEREAGELPTFDRKKVDDDKVLAFIDTARRKDPSVSRTRMHRILRDSGLACEQQRFKRLVEIFEETVDG